MNCEGNFGFINIKNAVEIYTSPVEFVPMDDDPDAIHFPVTKWSICVVMKHRTEYPYQLKVVYDTADEAERYLAEYIRLSGAMITGGVV